MFLTISSNDFDPHHIIISDKTKNNIMAGSDFYRLIYSNSLVSTNGVFIQFNLKNINIEKYFNKIKCNFENSSYNNTVISSVKSIEKMILNKFRNLENKNISCRIYEQLQNGYIKLYAQDNIKYGLHQNIKFLLKVSGIWVSNQTNEYGITFRFFIINNQF